MDRKALITSIINIVNNSTGISQMYDLINTVLDGMDTPAPAPAPAQPTLRDRFAMSVIAGSKVSNRSPNELTKHAYVVADAMMLERVQADTIKDPNITTRSELLGEKPEPQPHCYHAFNAREIDGNRYCGYCGIADGVVHGTGSAEPINSVQLTARINEIKWNDGDGEYRTINAVIPQPHNVIGVEDLQGYGTVRLKLTDAAISHYFGTDSHHKILMDGQVDIKLSMGAGNETN